MLRWIFMTGMGLLLNASLVAAQPESSNTRIVDLGEGCRIRIQMPEYTEIDSQGLITIFTPRKYDYPETTILLGCYVLSDKSYTPDFVRFDPTQKLWVKDMERYFQNNPVYTPSEREALDRAIRLQQLQAVNASGYAYTQDDITGREDGRVRQVRFALLHKERILYGGIGGRDFVMLINNPDSRDLTLDLLPIIQTIEFLEEDPAEASISTEKTDSETE